MRSYDLTAGTGTEAMDPVALWTMQGCCGNETKIPQDHLSKCFSYFKFNNYNNTKIYRYILSHLHFSLQITQLQ